MGYLQGTYEEPCPYRERFTLMVWKNDGFQIFIPLQWWIVARSIIQERLDSSPENSIFSIFICLPLAFNFRYHTTLYFSHIWKWQNKAAARQFRLAWENSEVVMLPLTCMDHYLLTFQIDLLIVLIQWNHYPKITALAFSHLLFNICHRKCCTLCFPSELVQFFKLCSRCVFMSLVFIAASYVASWPGHHHKYEQFLIWPMW